MMYAKNSANIAMQSYKHLVRQENSGAIVILPTFSTNSAMMASACGLCQEKKAVSA